MRSVATAQILPLHSLRVCDKEGRALAVGERPEIMRSERAYSPDILSDLLHGVLLLASRFRYAGRLPLLITSQLRERVSPRHGNEPLFTMLRKAHR